MEHIIGWISTGRAPALLARPLLGQPCREHVETALNAAGIALGGDDLALSTLDTALLWVREDGACISPETLGELASLGAEGKTALLLTLPMKGREQTLLAAAFPREALSTLPWESLEALTAKAMALPGAILHTPADPLQALAVEDGASYAGAIRLLNQRIIAGHMEHSVLFLDPERTMVDAGVRIGEGTLIYGGNVLQGLTDIGPGCTLYPNNRMENAKIGGETMVESSVLLDCMVGSHSTVGPYAYLRPGTQIGDHCRIGDFVEVKNSSIGDGTKVSHLTYVGDSDLGKDINLGCGVVFVNYDGKTKSRSRVEDHAFIGCNCNLVAPVHIGKNAYLAAGGTIVEDVPEDALYVARARGVVKEGWVRQRKEQGKL